MPVFVANIIADPDCPNQYSHHPLSFSRPPRRCDRKPPASRKAFTVCERLRSSSSIVDVDYPLTSSRFSHALFGFDRPVFMTAEYHENSPIDYCFSLRSGHKHKP
jgi:hypothetical protein